MQKALKLSNKGTVAGHNSGKPYTKKHQRANPNLKEFHIDYIEK